MELVVIVFGIAVVWTVLSMIDQRGKRAANNARLLEEALKNPALDRGMLETLTYQLTGRKPLTSVLPSNGVMAWVLGLGWITLFTGIGLLVAGEVEGCHELTTAGCIVGLVGFGLVTYPFALRELDARRVPQ